jgi:hypothetical protein
MATELAHRLHIVLDIDEMPHIERERLIRLMVRFAELPAPPGAGRLFPRFDGLRDGFLDAVEAGDSDLIEDRFLELYAHLHMHEAPYTPEERRAVDSSGGYWCHAGGLSPVLKAGDWIHEFSSSADLGAGNGLQGLLLQVLYPHRRSVFVEISGRMAEIGRDLQSWLGIPSHRVEWIVGDVLDVPIPEVDFLYLYRPVRPDGAGRAFYTRLAADLDARDRPIVVFSIADCLREFLSDRFRVFYTDGHLTCFRSASQRLVYRPPGSGR